MLKLRNEQMVALRQSVEPNFIDRIRAHLRKHYGPAVAATDDRELAEDIRRGLVRARDYGLTWESPLSRFVVYRTIVGVNFDRHRKIKRILRDESVPPNKRIGLLATSLTEEDWAAAAARR